ACLLSFNILLAPMAAVAAATNQKSEIRDQRSEQTASGPTVRESSSDKIFVNPLTAAFALPGPKPEPAPQPLPPPTVGAVTASMVGSPATVSPGGTINYTVTLGN